MMRSEASPPVFLAFPTANSVQRPYPPMYGVLFKCFGGLHSVLLDREGQLAILKKPSVLPVP
ncbi:hypothetical protein E2C01_055226 [Portunus trituberculatus]|uniref:Uncharacterized protein n=1 Tax=Portunus trituberculatus TaxID=210409 RepID=A0A5B7GQM1_PORTR|nr:hypothetical protein [Portunus trituberculatus]